jgi:hypothetical protein
MTSLNWGSSSYKYGIEPNYSLLVPESGRYTRSLKKDIINILDWLTTIPEKARKILSLTDTELDIWKWNQKRTTEEKRDILFKLIARKDIKIEGKYDLTEQESDFLALLKLFDWKVVPSELLLTLSKEWVKGNVVKVIINRLKSKLWDDYEIATSWWRWYKLIKN